MFDGGCTGVVVSDAGLLLTNHHCGFDAIQQLSSLEHNYVEDGYWAKDRATELPAPGVTAMFISRMEDVTVLALQNVSEGMGERDRESQIDKNIAQIKSTTKKEKSKSWCSSYNGNQYFLFVTQTFRDLRFVGAPPSSIGKYGADTDNWVWPRHTGDFSVSRYADKDGHPGRLRCGKYPLSPAALPASFA